MPSTVREGELFTTQILLDREEQSPEFLRAGGIEDIKDVTSLRLLVFDEQGKFLYSADAKVGEVVDVSAKPDDQFIPEQGRKGIAKAKQFEVQLYKSSRPRIIHLVANHDWSGFPQDYFAQGTHAGEFMTHESLKSDIKQLEGADPTKLALWSRVETQELNEQTFNGKVVKLFRNYAKLEIKVDQAVSSGTNANFTLEGFAMINLSDRGSIAPFVVKGFDVELSTHLDRASIPVGLKNYLSEAEVSADPNKLTFKAPTETYYLFEKANKEATEKLAIILKGKRTNTQTGVTNETRYYKLDLVRRPDARRGIESIRTYFDIIRNKHYVVEIKGIMSDGFQTIKEAVEAPAGNNVFADTKLQDFKKISDGVASLVVDPIQMIIVQPGIYTVSSQYILPSPSDAHIKYLKYYPSWDAVDLVKSWKQPVTPTAPDDEGYMYRANSDPYMGKLEKTDEGFLFEVKEIPVDAIPTYAVEVVALREYRYPAGSTNPPTQVDGTTGATSPLTRKVWITLRPPYEFFATLEQPSATQKDKRTLKFRVYKDIPKNLFPFPVYIKAAGITPINKNTKKNVMVEYFKNPETGRFEVFYRYMVQEADQAAGSASLDFKVNDHEKAGTGDVKLLSEFYRDQIIQNDKTLYYYANLSLAYNKPQMTTARYLHPTTNFLFEINGQKLNDEQLYEKYQILFEKDMQDWYGRCYMSISQGEYNTLKNKKLKVSSYETIANNPETGYVKYTISKTLTIEEWMRGYHDTPGTSPVNNVWDFQVEEVEIEGRIYFYYLGWSGYSWVRYYWEKPDRQPSVWAGANNQGWSEDDPKDLSSDFTIDDTMYYNRNRVGFYHFRFKTTNIAALAAKPYLKVFYLDILAKTRYQYGYAALSLSDLENNPFYEVNVGNY